MHSSLSLLASSQNHYLAASRNQRARLDALAESRRTPAPAAPVVTEVEFGPHDFLDAMSYARNGGGQYCVLVGLSDGSTEIVATYFADELFFSESDFLGKTAAQCAQVHFRRDQAYLGS